MRNQDSFLKKYYNMPLSKEYKRNLHKLKKQTPGYGTCGIIALKNSLLLSYDLDISEEELLFLGQRFYNENRIKRDIKTEGIGPKAIASIAKKIIEQKKRASTKSFSRRMGSIDQLVCLLDRGIVPIIHRPSWEDDLDGHYETFLGLNGQFAYLFNSSNDMQTSGFYKIPSRTFENYWWRNPKFQNERWFMAFYPSSLILPSKVFKGEKLAN
jgi:hypothetical protein